jgi:hypothetical protein
MKLSEEDKMCLFETLKEDVGFLEKHGLMDYSLILGVISQSEEAQIQQSRNHWTNPNGSFHYYLAIIDYLQLFDFSKRLETQFKHIRYPNKKYQVSSISPLLYAARFLNFIQNSFLNLQK